MYLLNRAAGRQILQYAFVPYEPGNTEKTEGPGERLSGKSLQIDARPVQKDDFIGRNDPVFNEKRGFFLAQAHFLSSPEKDIKWLLAFY